MSLIIPQNFWKYCQEEGSLWDPQGAKVGIGYSGHDVGLNNPTLQGASNVGPIPQGVWRFAEHETGSGHLGPCAIAIEPVFGTTTYNRTGFFLHGDTNEDVLDHTKNASHGCLVFPRNVREAVLRSLVKELVVVKNEGTSP